MIEPTGQKVILLIDNYDSFAHNLARYLRNLSQPTAVVRNDCIDFEGVRQAKPDAIVLSPGPGTPQKSGCCMDVVAELHREVPILGVCLGHQAIAVALGGDVIRSVEPIHGMSCPVYHRGHRLFEGVPSPFEASRYHSLEVATGSLPSRLVPIAWSGDQQLMAISHLDYPIIGVQFHPESILTEFGYRILENFLTLGGLHRPNHAFAGFSGEIDAESPPRQVVRSF